jgi:hypothetical protein
VDIQTAMILTAWTVAMTAAIRKLDSRIDGLWVLVCASLCAMLSSFAYCSPNWVDALRYSAIAFIGAIGGVQFLDRFRVAK